MDQSTLDAIEKSSNLPSTPEAALPAEDVNPTPKPKVKITPKKSKVAHKVKKEDTPSEEKPKAPAHKVAHKTKKDDLPPEVRLHDDSLQVRTFNEDAAPPKKQDDEDGPAPASDANADISADAGAEAADPSVDAQADQFIEQIKAASANIKSANGDGDSE